nr:ricin lectin domain-containing protein 3 [Arenicola marina]
MPAGKYFVIKSQLSGLVLDVSGEHCHPGVDVILYGEKADKNDNQLWWADRLTSTIRTKLDSTMCLQASSGSTLVLQKYDPSNNDQKWVIGKDRIHSQHDANRVLDVSGKSTSQGAKVVAWEYHGDKNQLWTFHHKPATFFYIVSKLHGKTLDVKKANPDEGTKVILWEKKDAVEDNQLWYENKDGLICSKLNDFALDNLGELGKSVRLQVPHAGKRSQMWSVRGERIVHMEAEDEVMEVRGGEPRSGGKVSAAKWTGSDQQRWEVKEAKVKGKAK